MKHPLHGHCTIVALVAAALLLPIQDGAAASRKATSAKSSGKDVKQAEAPEQQKAEEEAPPEPPPAPKPWEEGISAEDQARARAIFKEGTVLLNDASFAPAAQKLEEALAIWGHPAIHYNMAMAQVQMDHPLEARKHLLAATAFGAEAIGDTTFESAKTYLKLVERQLSPASISASIDGVEVLLDGKPLFTSPATFQDYLPSGTHALVAKKEGYLTSELSETFEPGTEKTLNIKLYTADELTEYRHRWPVWMPWTVFGAGVAVAAVGGVLHGIGHSKVSDFDSNAKANGLMGVVTTDDDRDMRRTGIDMQKGAVGLYAVGGAAIATGITLVILNKAKPYLFGKPVEESQSADGSIATPTASSVMVVPVVSDDGAGVAASLDF